MDLDEEIRRELLLDVQKWLPLTGPANGILVTGDVAFSGKESQYEMARTWLRSLAEKAGCQPEDVWVVPGNHDVDRSIIANNELLKMTQQRIRNHALNDRDAVNDAVLKACQDAGMSKLLLAPLDKFNSFVATYGGICKTSTDGLAWQHDLPFEHGYMLRLWGINSVLASDASDSPNQMAISGHQLPIREEGVVYVSLCHHPPSWMLDSDQVEERLDQRASIQLYGHRHHRRTILKERSLILHAGALHPERGKGAEWNPRYNVIQLSLTESDGAPRLVVRVWGREWKEEHCFGPMVLEGELVGKYEVKLDMVPLPSASTRPAVGSSPAAVHGTEPDPVPLTWEDPAESDEGKPLSPHGTTVAMDSMRSLVYRFYDLPYRCRQQIIVDLGLLQDEDEGVKEPELVRRVVERIRVTNRIDEFRRAIEAAHT